MMKSVDFDDPHSGNTFPRTFQTIVTTADAAGKATSDCGVTNTPVDSPFAFAAIVSPAGRVGGDKGVANQTAGVGIPKAAHSSRDGPYTPGTASPA
jgi:hypothetical protein